MGEPELSAVTGAYSFTGKYIARRLLDRGDRVMTLTGHPDRDHPFGDAVPARPLDFDHPKALTDSLEGVNTLFNTFWIRFERDEITFDWALSKTRTLLQAAKDAGLRRVVHISIVHADEGSPFPYFSAKGKAERLVRDSGLEFTIIRPTVLFGREGILFNNIAWLLRKFPFFTVPGGGDYRLQPVFVEDLAELATDAGYPPRGETFDAAGPETFVFDELLKLIARHVGCKPRLLHVNPEMVLRATSTLGGMVDDVLLTRDEIKGLVNGLLVSDDPPRGKTPFSAWAEKNSETLGQSYISELKRHFP